MQLLAPMANETMRDYSLRVLRQNIISLDMEPGKMYSEKELSSALGLSRTPMREALLQLSKTKIIEIYPKRGSVVALIDYDLVNEARFVREALECAVVKEVCQCVLPEQLELLQRNANRQLRCLEIGNVQALMPLDNEFHRLLFAIAKKMQCYEFVTNMTIHMDRVRSMAITAVKEYRFVNEHQELLKAIYARDGEKAHNLMREHLSRFLVDEQSLRSKYPQYFKEQAHAS